MSTQRPVIAMQPKPVDELDKLVSEALDNCITALGQCQKGTARQFLHSAINAALAAEREQVKRISDFAAEVVNAKKDPIAICINCGEIQLDQLDEICQTCQRAELRSLTDLREQLAAEREAASRTTKPEN